MGLLAEYGITIPKGISHIRSCLPEIMGSNEDDLSVLMLDCLKALYENFQRLDE